MQTGLTLNEMIGVLNGAVSSLQAENQRRLTDISNSKKALQLRMRTSGRLHRRRHARASRRCQRMRHAEGEDRALQAAGELLS